MKDNKVVPSTNGVATVEVAGQTRHYFQSEKLGSCYAFIPTPPQQSHVDLVNEEILSTLHQELESLMASLKIVALDDHDFYASILEKIKAVRQQISDLENDRC